MLIIVIVVAGTHQGVGACLFIFSCLKWSEIFGFTSMQRQAEWDEVIDDDGVVRLSI